MHWLLIVSYYITGNVHAFPKHQDTYQLSDETTCFAVGFAFDQKDPASKYPDAIRREWECAPIEGSGN